MRSSEPKALMLFMPCNVNGACETPGCTGTAVAEAATTRTRDTSPTDSAEVAGMEAMDALFPGRGSSSEQYAGTPEASTCASQRQGEGRRTSCKKG